MGNNVEVAERADSGEVTLRPTRTVEDIVASRAVATDRVSKGGSLAVLGFGGALLIDFLNLSPGLPFWISISAALTAFGAGAIWAGSGASHLIRHGGKGSSLWLISLAGLGGSVILNVVSGILLGTWNLPILEGLNLLAMASCGLFTAALIVLGLITIVRWIIPAPNPMRGGTASGASEIERIRWDRPHLAITRLPLTLLASRASSLSFRAPAGILVRSRNPTRWTHGTGFTDSVGISEMIGSLELSAARLQSLLLDLLSQKKIRQAVMAVESTDGSVRWADGVGDAGSDGTPMKEDIPFFTASIDKLFNATIAMKLTEASRLDLDETISAYLPSSLTRGLHRAGGTDRSDRITVRHLLGHTSGLADWLEDCPKGGRSLYDRVVQDGDLAIEIEDLAAVVRDDLQPHFPPQDLSGKRPRVRYSDTDFMLLIAVIEAVAGQPLHELHEEMLFRPLGLRHTYFAGRSQPLDPTLEPAVLRIQGEPLHIPLLIRSVRGVYSTVRDAVAFLRNFVRGDVFEDRGTLASMQQQWNRFGIPLDRAALRSPGWPIEYGLGIMRFRLPRIFTSLRPLPAVLGHTGSTGSWLFHCERLDVLMAGSVDEVTAGAVPYRIVPKILQVLGSSG